MRIVVVGGVAAGASTAARARRLDEEAEIIVLERGEYVSFANCGLPYHIGGIIKDRERLLLQTPESLHEMLDIDVRTGNEVTDLDPGTRTVTVHEVASGNTYQLTYDALALCQGADPARPPLPGIDLPGIHTLRNVEDMDAIVTDLDAAATRATSSSRRPRALVVGAGYIGVELAENLHDRGFDVSVVELSDQILPPLDKEVSIPVEQHLRGHGVDLTLGAKVRAFSATGTGGIRAELSTGASQEADIVLLSTGVRPNTALARSAGLEVGERGGLVVDTHMRTSDPHIWAAGDMVETPHTVLGTRAVIALAGPANRQGRVVAENICGRDTQYTSTQGTSVVKVFDMVAGGTGATERQLQRAGIAHAKVHIHPSGHAGYYPDTAQMHLELLFSPEDGRILGAQIAGFDGVDKRLDVLATALRLGATVHDLESLELAYAPPFGSAKDPVNMAGFVASNVLSGDLCLWYAEDFPDAVEGCRIVDVRTPEEFAIWHIPGAVNVPLGEIRAACEDWDREQPVRLYCAVGFRSYLAHRILVQRGFTHVATLSGGSTTFRFWHDLEPVGFSARPAEVHYASHTPTAPANGTGHVVDLDCTGLACPGPIMKLSTTMEGLSTGDEIVVTVSDPGFAHDAPAWAASHGHELRDLTPHGAGYVATFRKGAAHEAAAGTVVRGDDNQVSFVVFSGDLDKAIAAFIIANGALAMGQDVSMFFTFWGLNTLRRTDAPARERTALERAMTQMMPSGPDSLPLSQMNMAGMGAAMIKKVMKDHNVPSLPELMASAHQGGARFIACTMTMDLLGISASDLLPDIEFGGVATFLAEAKKSGTTLFI